jgi:hypothetical protein
MGPLEKITSAEKSSLYGFTGAVAGSELSE